jgi:hypothetical protein
VELAAFITLRATQMVLRLARAELSEVLGSFGDDVGKELELDSSKRFPCKTVRP